MTLRELSAANLCRRAAPIPWRDRTRENAIAAVQERVRRRTSRTFGRWMESVLYVVRRTIRPASCASEGGVVGVYRDRSVADAACKRLNAKIAAHDATLYEVFEATPPQRAHA